MLIYDNIENSYYEVIPVKKIDEKIEKLKEFINKINNENEGFYTDESIYFDGQKTILEELIKENTESEE